MEFEDTFGKRPEKRLEPGYPLGRINPPYFPPLTEDPVYKNSALDKKTPSEEKKE